MGTRRAAIILKRFIEVRLLTLRFPPPVITMKFLASIALVVLCGFARCEVESPVADAAPVAAEPAKPVEDVPAPAAEEEIVEDEPEEEDDEEVEDEDEEEDEEEELEDDEEDEEEEDEEEEADKPAEEDSDIYIYNFTNSQKKSQEKKSPAVDV